MLPSPRDAESDGPHICGVKVTRTHRPSGRLTLRQPEAETSFSLMVTACGYFHFRAECRVGAV